MNPLFERKPNDPLNERERFLESLSEDELARLAIEMCDAGETDAEWLAAVRDAIKQMGE